MFSKAHDKIVYNQLKQPACNFKTYKPVHEWASQWPDLTVSNPCGFTERDWRTVCLNKELRSYCPQEAVKTRPYWTRFHTPIADAYRGPGKEEQLYTFLDEQLYVSGSVKTWRNDFWRGLPQKTSFPMKNLAMECTIPNVKTMASLTLYESIKKTLIGQSDDIFQEKCK